MPEVAGKDLVSSAEDSGVPGSQGSMLVRTAGKIGAAFNAH
jgi:hypothetical protein